MACDKVQRPTMHVPCPHRSHSPTEDLHLDLDHSDTDQNNGMAGTPRNFAIRWRPVICLLVSLSGLSLGALALALVSNRFGNTDTIGLPLLGLAGWATGTGLLHLRFRLRDAALLGLFAAPLTVVAVFLLFWMWLAFTAVATATG